MTRKSGLGAGLDALFGPEPEDDQQITLPISRVEPRADQPRRTFDEEALADLTESIRKYGLIQPVTVRPLDGGYYQIIAGERRWRASRDAGLDEIPVRILDVDDRTAMELALVENLQREDLNPIEEAKGYQTLMSDYGLTQEETASAVGKSRPAVANALRLLNLSDQVLKQVEDGQLTPGHARALLSISDEVKQTETAQTVIQRQLTVRQTEALVKRILQERPTKEQTEDKVSVDYVREVERELETSMGRKVHLIDGKKKGKIEIEFYGAEDREKLIENLRLFSSLRRTK